MTLVALGCALRPVEAVRRGAPAGQSLLVASRESMLGAAGPGPLVFAGPGPIGGEADDG